MGKKSKIKSINKIKYFSLLMVSQYNRRELFPLILENIKSQTRLDLIKEYIIINGSINKEEHDLFERYLLENVKEKIECLGIRFKYIETSKLNIYGRIGALRNEGNKCADEDYIIWMDDDDYYSKYYIEEALKGLSTKVELVGCSGNYLYDIYYDCLYKVKGFGINHTINCVLGYTKEYGKSHLYDSNKRTGEESSFLENYKNKLYQMNPRRTILQFSHNLNTFSKMDLLDKNVLIDYLGKDSKIIQSDENILELIEEEKLERYMKIYKSNNDENYDVLLYLGTIDEYSLTNISWYYKIIESEYKNRGVCICGKFFDIDKKPDNVKLISPMELNNKGEINTLWVSNTSGITPYLIGIKKLEYKELILSITKLDEGIIKYLRENSIKKVYIPDERLGMNLLRIKSSNYNLIKDDIILNENVSKIERIVMIGEMDEIVFNIIEYVLPILKEYKSNIELLLITKNRQMMLDNRKLRLLSSSGVIWKWYRNESDIVNEIKSSKYYLDLPGRMNDYNNLYLRSAIRYNTISIVPYSGSYLSYNLPSYFYNMGKIKNILGLGEYLRNLILDERYQRIILSRINKKKSKV